MQAQFQIRLFAGAKQAVGAGLARVALEPPHTTAQLRAALISQYPQIAPLVAHSRIAVNAAYAAPDQKLSPTDEIALIPPVSGG
jgi:molybdopterin converting factor small subunit